MNHSNSKNRGFSLAELLIVVGIISLIIGIVLPSVIDVRAQARDKQRIADLHRFYLGLLKYHDDKNGLPLTSAYGETNPGGWDYSSLGNFLTPLQTEKYVSTNLQDPLNNGTGDVFYGGSGYAYGYFCYPGSHSQYPNTFSLGVRVERPAALLGVVDSGPKLGKEIKGEIGQTSSGVYVYWIANHEPVKSCQ